MRWLNVSQPNLDTYSLMTAIWKIWSELPGHLPHGLGKTRFLGPTLNFDQTYLCNGTRYQQSERNLSIYRDSSIHAPKIRWTLVLWFRNGWERLPSFCPPKFSQLETLPALPHGCKQANFGMCYVVARACSLKQQNAGRAHDGPVHTSTYYLLINASL